MSHNRDLVHFAHPGPARVTWVGSNPHAGKLAYHRIGPAGPCAPASGARTWSLSLVKLFSHMPWPIFGQGSGGLARWAEIVFLCSH